MRVIEPNQSAGKAAIKKRRHFPVVVSVLILLCAGLFLVMSGRTHAPIEAEKNQESVAPQTDSNETIDAVLSDSEFRQLYNNLRQPNTARIENPPPIVTDDLADRHIIELAEARGYLLRYEATDQLKSVDGVLLQPDAADGWIALKSAAQKAGLSLQVTSGYRSVNEQLSVFRTRLNATNASLASIANGSIDKQLEAVMDRTAPPGYSRHHSGYALDLFCPGTDFYKFQESKCHEWLVADNYKQARLHGFIPSYPDQTTLQGPKPEAWEYIWVGTELTQIGSDGL